MIKFEKTFSDACILTASVATNGFHGGDAGHGSKTELILDMDGIEVSFENDKLTIKFGGDAELRVITRALSFMAASLKTITDEDSTISLNNQVIKPTYKES